MRSRRGGFTLVEVLVATVLVSVTIVAVMGGIKTLGQSDVKIGDAELLNRLAYEKFGEIPTVNDPSQLGGSGDFSDRGYPDITWALTEQPSGADNVDQVTVTVTQGTHTESVTGLSYINPTVAGTTTTSTP